MPGAAHGQTGSWVICQPNRSILNSNCLPYWHWRGAVVPVPRAAGLALPEHTSCPDLGFLLLEIPWLSCSPRPDTTPRLNWCLPGAAWDMQKPHATKSPVTWGPRSCPSEPWRGHKLPNPGHVLLQSRG